MSLSRWVFSLKGVVQNYSWGGFDFIPSLIGTDNKNQQPFAEYWMGAHPNHPSRIMETGEFLDNVIQADKEQWIGREVSGQFGSLPFLLKILDVRQMLSIQVHPDIPSAIKGYEEEQTKGIALNAGNRNYKDRNHKPELMVALGDFWLLHGFKNRNELKTILERTPELDFLVKTFSTGGYKLLYEEVMLMDQDKVNSVLGSLMKRIIPLYEKGKLQKESEDFWAARASLNFCRNGQFDRGIFSIYFFNLLHLVKGEGIYQQSGLPHAYLEGQNIEIMANSDNVLRAGLTDKHIDVPELMKHVAFAEAIPEKIKVGAEYHTIYPSPAREFELHRYELAAGKEISFTTDSPGILLVLEGMIKISGGVELDGHTGDCFYCLPGHEVKLRSLHDTTIFHAKVPRVEKLIEEII